MLLPVGICIAKVCMIIQAAAIIPTGSMRMHCSGAQITKNTSLWAAGAFYVHVFLQVLGLIVGAVGAGCGSQMIADAGACTHVVACCTSVPQAHCSGSMISALFKRGVAVLSRQQQCP